MNANTRDALIAFIDQVEILAQGCIHMTGEKDCLTLLTIAERLKDQLKSDETIP